MNKDEAHLALRKGSLALAKSWVDEHGHEHIVCDGQTTEDILRMVRNGIWNTYGPEELDTLEAEIDLGL